MAIGPVRFVGSLFFNGFDRGWSENYFIGSDSYADALTALLDLKDLRLAMLVSDIALVHIRLSDTDVKGDSYPAGQVYPQPGTFAVSPADLSYNLDLALRILFFGGTLKRGSRFLHALPKSQVNAEGFYVPTAPFGGALSAWIAAVTLNANIATRIKGTDVAPFYTYTAITGDNVGFLEGRKMGRPFGLTAGRRLIA